MKVPKLDQRIPRFAELGYAGLLLIWFVLPFFLGSKAGLVPGRLGSQVGMAGPAALLATALAWLIPLVALWKIAFYFLEEKLPAFLGRSGWVYLFLGFLASGAVVFSHLLHMFAFASKASYFWGVGILSWLVLAMSMAYNAVTLTGLVRLLGSGDSSRKELSIFKAERESDADAKVYAGIQRRLLLSFLALITVVIVVICAVLLGDFSRTLLSSVIANGESIVDRTASMAKSSPGDGKDHISREDYLRDEAGKNKKAIFPFNNLTYYRNDSKTSTFVAMESTLASQVGRKLKASEVNTKETGWQEGGDGKHIDFSSPVVLSGKVLGLVSAEYDRDVIYEPYFRTQTKVFAVAALFIYFSIFLTYFLGRAIVLPLLFLNMSVNRISRTLSGMIGGRIKIAADLLTYTDHVKTKDEIKGLSVEIGDMTTVIRGVVPYISASTLKYADRGKPVTESRDLAFLFTDIRGFTTLCEGRSPGDVVELLNHYLALQSSLILENGGDIDKFVGDEIMAMFEGPDKELKACRAGVAIRKAMAREKELALAANEHVVAIGIGINTGPVIFGSVGAQNRMDFTSIGDTVNLAARLEGANKEYGTKTLITEAVWEAAKNEFLCREIDLMTVKGKSKPVRIYEILRAKAEGKSKLDIMAADFEAGLAAYRAQDWPKAVEQFKKLVAEYKDETSSIFLSRIAMFKRNPPPQDWDGVFALNVK